MAFTSMVKLTFQRIELTKSQLKIDLLKKFKNFNYQAAKCAEKCFSKIKETRRNDGNHVQKLKLNQFKLHYTFMQGKLNRNYHFQPARFLQTYFTYADQPFF